MRKLDAHLRSSAKPQSDDDMAWPFPPTSRLISQYNKKTTLMHHVRRRDASRRTKHSGNPQRVLRCCEHIGLSESRKESIIITYRSRKVEALFGCPGYLKIRDVPADLQASKTVKIITVLCPLLRRRHKRCRLLHYSGPPPPLSPFSHMSYSLTSLSRPDPDTDSLGSSGGSEGTSSCSFFRSSRIHCLLSSVTQSTALQILCAMM
jgi:hypothetical protein